MIDCASVARIYFLIGRLGMFVAFPLFVAMLFTPFPAAWFLMFPTIFPYFSTPVRPTPR